MYEALQMWGEKVLIRTKWTSEDFERGLVGRCPECNAGGEKGLQDMVRDAYAQSGDSWCPSCYGVGFDGGFRPYVHVVWSIVEDLSEDIKQSRTGEMEDDRPRSQFPWEPALSEFDLMVRVREWNPDGSPAVEWDRYRLRAIQYTTLRTGPRHRQGGDFFAEPEGNIVGQGCQVENLAPHHPWREVPVWPSVPVAARHSAAAYLGDTFTASHGAGAVLVP